MTSAVITAVKIDRFEVGVLKPEYDARSSVFSEKLSRKFNSKITVRWIDVFWVRSSVELHDIAQKILIDPVLHEPTLKLNVGKVGVERRLHPGMTDNRSRTFKEALALYLPAETISNLEVISGDWIEILETPNAATEAAVLNELKNEWTNSWIQVAVPFSSRENAGVFRKPGFEIPAPEMIVLAGLSDEQLVSMSRERLLALSLDEMKAIQQYFKTAGRDPTDVELEILAQTWSEHCKHKIFGADVRYSGPSGFDGNTIPNRIQSLFKTTIAQTTKLNPKPWLLSVFKDNAGIVAMNDDEAICLKVETHNSPSALDPFGGAITGIVGVNRDILGTGIGARPIFNTNVFCVGPNRHVGSVPDRMHHPADLLEGVREGVEAGGNQSGIPTINGAVYFDECFMGKPLVFVGSGGWMPRKIRGRPIEEKIAFPGDLIFMVGGRIGKDGIHGATFSSLALEGTMPSSVVQLGDPITQKRMTDFLIEARDRGLIQTLTDNGAGGLSSSVGELAQLTGGAKIDVGLALTKYPGMPAWERIVSESQERMTVVVRPENQNAFEQLSRHFQVEASCLGEMTDQGYFEILDAGKTVGKISLEFLHEGCPKLSLNATWTQPLPVKKMSTGTTVSDQELRQTLLALLGRPNIASKEWIIRQYDHEVQGTSVVKPLQTRPWAKNSTGEGQETDPPKSSPNSAGVQRIRPDSTIGVAVACGLFPEGSKVDPYWMAQVAVDESVRNVLAAGGEYQSNSPNAVMALIDNFCWPDPTQDSEKMGALVRTCFGLHHAAMELGLPLISGKDSMKNDFRGTWDQKPVTISVIPTLLMTAIARVQDVRHDARTSDFKNEGDLIYRLGPDTVGLLASEWSRMKPINQNVLSFWSPDWEVARRLYSWLGSPDSRPLKSAADISDGGLAVALTECLFSREFGLDVDISLQSQRSLEFWFGEGFHRFVVSIDPSDQNKMETSWIERRIPFQKLGMVSKKSAGLFQTNLEESFESWSRGARP